MNSHAGRSSLWLAIPLAAVAVLAAVIWLRPPPVPPSSPIPLKVISYNVQFLPSAGRLFNKRAHADYRAQEQGRLLAAYDIIGLNEVFDAGPRDLLLKTLREQLGADYHEVRPPAEARSAFGIDSGLAIVSRLPILASHSTRYGNDSSPAQYGLTADGFAAKGALHARIGRHKEAPPGECLDVFVTHLESKDKQARLEQYTLLGAFIKQHSAPERPALILGDFNTRGNPAYRKEPAEPYHRLLAALKDGRHGADVVDLWPQLSQEEGGTSNQETATGGSRIDYIFLSNPTQRAVLTPKAMRVNRFLDPKVVALSDHSAVEAELEWR